MFVMGMSPHIALDELCETRVKSGLLLYPKKLKSGGLLKASDRKREKGKQAPND
jgi:hypothetical protein